MCCTRLDGGLLKLSLVAPSSCTCPLSALHPPPRSPSPAIPSQQHGSTHSCNPATHLLPCNPAVCLLPYALLSCSTPAPLQPGNVPSALQPSNAAIYLLHSRSIACCHPRCVPCSLRLALKPMGTGIYPVRIMLTSLDGLDTRRDSWALGRRLGAGASVAQLRTKLRTKPRSPTVFHVGVCQRCAPEGAGVPKDPQGPHAVCPCPLHTTKAGLGCGAHSTACLHQQMRHAPALLGGRASRVGWVCIQSG